MRIGISGIIWGPTDSVVRREGGVTVGQVVFPQMNAQARSEVARIKEEQRARDLFSRAMARRERNSIGLG